MSESTTYTLLIYRTGAGMAQPDREGADLQHHRSVQTLTSARGDLHAVAQLGEVKTAKVITSKQGAHDMTDGPYIDAKEWLVGFYLVDCLNEEEALAHARELCINEEYAIEVRPVSWRWKR